MAVHLRSWCPAGLVPCTAFPSDENFDLNLGSHLEILSRHVWEPTVFRLACERQSHSEQRRKDKESETHQSVTTRLSRRTH